MKSGNRSCNASRRKPAAAIALVLLLGLCGARPIVHAEAFTIGGTGAALGTMTLLAREFTDRHPQARITVMPSLGSGGSIKAVLDGAIGLAVSSRALNDSERQRGAVAIEYARTPFVFAVARKSAVTAMTSVELANIYAGSMVSWPDGSPVRIVLRPASDIDTEIVKNISPDIRRGVHAAYGRPGVRVSVNDQDAADDMEKIAGAIGPSTLSLILSERRALRALKLDGVDPTPANAASGAYPLFKTLFLVTGARRSAEVERFINFVRSPEARKILTGHGQWTP